MARKFPSWLQALSLYAEETEAPRQFWTWAGISTIASALQRKVWLPFGFEKLYPNLYVILVGPPASRKAAPISLRSLPRPPRGRFFASRESKSLSARLVLSLRR
jgi:hypothetical protein